MYYTHNAGWYDVQCEHTVSVDMCIGMAHILNQFVVYLASNGCKVNLVYSRGDLVLTHIRELVDSLCRDGTDTTRPFSRCRMAQTCQTWQLQALSDTCTNSVSVPVPAKALKVHEIHGYNDRFIEIGQTALMFIIIFF